MSEIKSIISIEIQDEQYRNFIDSFNEYNDSLNSQSKVWKNIASSASKSTIETDKLSEDTKAILEALSGSNEQLVKLNKQFSKTYDQSKNTRKNFSDILGFSKETTSLMAKWGSIGLGIGGALGTGIAVLSSVASSESNLRRETKTLGISAGELQSQEVNFGKFIDVGSHLHSLNSIRNDISKRGFLAAAGLGGLDKLNNSDFLAQSLLKVRDTYIKHGANEQAAQAFGLHEVGFSTDELQLLKNTTEAEIKAAIEKEKSDRKLLQQTDEQLKSWQELNVQIDLFTRSLKTVTADVLLPIAKLINNPKESVSEVKSGLSQGWGRLLSHPIDFITGNTKAFSNEKANKFSKLAQLEAVNNIPAGTLKGIWGTESNYGKNAGYSSAGALGDFQFMSGTAKQYGISDRTNFDQSSAGAAKYMANLMKMFKNDLRKAIAAYNWGEGNLKKDIAKYGSKWEEHLPKETKNYINKVLANSNQTVNINNNTGGNAVVALSSAAH